MSKPKLYPHLATIVKSSSETIIQSIVVKNEAYMQLIEIKAVLNDDGSITVSYNPYYYQHTSERIDNSHHHVTIQPL